MLGAETISIPKHRDSILDTKEFGYLLNPFDIVNSC